MVKGYDIHLVMGDHMYLVKGTLSVEVPADVLVEEVKEISLAEKAGLTLLHMRDLHQYCRQILQHHPKRQHLQHVASGMYERERDRES